MLTPRIILLTCCLAGISSAQTPSVTGTVRESGGGDPLGGVTVTLEPDSGAGRKAVVFTDLKGRYAVSASSAGSYSLTFRSIGYREERKDGIVLLAGDPLTVDAFLEPVPLDMDAVIVSASRRPEKVVDAPGSTSVIDAERVSSENSVTAVDHLRGTGGIDIAETGVMQRTVVARGFNNVFSTSLTMLTDNRNAAVPSLRANIPAFIPVTDDDIERIEVVRGPASALYGPNANSGVVNIITKSPFASRGTTVSLSGGTRSLFGGSFRHAGTAGEKFGYKVSGQYFKARDWKYLDPFEAAARGTALAEGALPDTLRIGRREAFVERFGAEARMDAILAADATVNLTLGLNQAVRTIELTDIGASQGRDWRYGYVQSRFTWRSLFLQAFLNASDAGSSYILRTGQPVVDRSKMFVAQAQNSSAAGDVQMFTYGVDLILTRPVTDGTITGRNENDDDIDEFGAYLQSETRVVPGLLDLVLAGRVDRNDRLKGVVFSPRAAVVYKPSAGQSLRLTFNRAYSAPNTTELFLDILAEENVFGFPDPYSVDIRGSGIPSGGYLFARNAAGRPYLHSPLSPDRSVAIPVDDVSVLWPAMVGVLASQGIDLTSIPAPSSSDIGAVLGVLNTGTAKFSPVNGVADVPRLSPTITRTVELGYKGTLGGVFSAGFDLYQTHVTDFIGQFEVRTPNVFMNEADVRDYLEANGISPGNAASYASVIGGIPLGTVTPEGVADPVALLVTPRNFGTVDLWGADVSVGFTPDPSWTISGAVSFLDDNFFEKIDGSADLSLNAPKTRANVAVGYRHRSSGIHLEVRGRWMSGFRMMSGVYEGDVPPAALLDATAGADLGWIPGMSVIFSASNITGKKHREFVGAPDIGRLLITKVRYTI